MYIYIYIDMCSKITYFAEKFDEFFFIILVFVVEYAYK